MDLRHSPPPEELAQWHPDLAKEVADGGASGGELVSHLHLQDVRGEGREGEVLERGREGGREG